MRQLATLQKIDKINPIPDADAIEVATVNGWKVVVKKNEFKVGDKIVFFEIDSWVPHALAPFLSKNEPKTYQGIQGEKLRTIKLRGQISQGLILPESILGNSNLEIGSDVTEILGVVKWEPPISAQLEGMTKGNFPSFLIKTDEERVQNLSKYWNDYIGLTFNVHEKLDGSSCTIYRYNDEFGVCSRNLDLKQTEGNSFWKVALENKLDENLPNNLCIQGELVGPGVQKNIYGLPNLRLYVFNVYDILEGKYIEIERAKEIAESLGLTWAPFHSNYTITNEDTVQSLLSMAEGGSALNPNTEREGLVWRSNGTERISFKTISNKFLLKNND
jgi:RNA ligase (TIGR02306 family)